RFDRIECDELEQPSTGQPEKLLDDLDERRRGNDLPLVQAALPGIREDQIVAVHADVRLAKRADPEGPVRYGVPLAACTEVRTTDQPNDRRQHLLPIQTAPLQVTIRGCAQLRQSIRNVQHPPPLLPVLPLDVTGTVAVLLATRSVEPPDLDLPLRVGRDVDVRPGRRNHERPDPRERRLRSQLPTIRTDIAEPTARVALTAPPGLWLRLLLSARLSPGGSDVHGPCQPGPARPGAPGPYHLTVPSIYGTIPSGGILPGRRCALQTTRCPQWRPVSCRPWEPACGGLSRVLEARVARANDEEQAHAHASDPCREARARDPGQGAGPSAPDRGAGARDPPDD